jgi:hypothetical protein
VVPVKAVDPLGRFTVFGPKLEIIGHVDPFYDEHGALSFDLSSCL